MEIITGYTGENHVTSADDASLYRGIVGIDDYVLDVGNKFEASIIDNNTVRILDGDLLIQGHQVRIRANDYNEVTIDNGTPGQKRNDLIVARYLKNTETGIESITLEVIKGTPGIAAIDPEIIQEDLKVGGTQRDYPLYRVALDGISLTSLTTLFNIVPTFNTHLAESASKHIHSSGSNTNGNYIKFDDGTIICNHTISLGSVESGSADNDIWVYPATVLNPNLNIKHFTNSSNSVEAIKIFSGLFFSTTNSQTSYFYRNNSGFTYDMKLYLSVVGRWE